MPIAVFAGITRAAGSIAVRGARQAVVGLTRGQGIALRRLPQVMARRVTYMGQKFLIRLQDLADSGLDYIRRFTPRGVLQGVGPSEGRVELYQSVYFESGVNGEEVRFTAGWRIIPSPRQRVQQLLAVEYGTRFVEAQRIIRGGLSQIDYDEVRARIRQVFNEEMEIAIRRSQREMRQAERQAYRRQRGR